MASPKHSRCSQSYQPKSNLKSSISLLYLESPDHDPAPFPHPSTPASPYEKHRYQRSTNVPVHHPSAYISTLTSISYSFPKRASSSDLSLTQWLKTAQLLRSSLVLRKYVPKLKDQAYRRMLRGEFLGVIVKLILVCMFPTLGMQVIGIILRLRNLFTSLRT